MNTFKQFLAACLVCSGLGYTAASSAAVVNLSLSSPAQAGAFFTVDVLVSELFVGLASNEELLAFGMTVANSSPGLFSFTGSSIAAPFDDDSALVGLAAAGSVFPGIQNQPANQSILLATLTFYALDSGSGTLGIRSDLNDPNQGLIFLQSTPLNLNADLAVTVAPVPLPAALPLLLAGVSLFAGFAQRRRGGAASDGAV